MSDQEEVRKAFEESLSKAIVDWFWKVKIEDGAGELVNTIMGMIPDTAWTHRPSVGARAMTPDEKKNWEAMFSQYEPMRKALSDALYAHRPASIQRVPGLDSVEQWLIENGRSPGSYRVMAETFVEMAHSLLTTAPGQGWISVIDAIYDRATRALADPADGDVMALTDICNLVEAFKAPLPTAPEVKP